MADERSTVRGRPSVARDCAEVAEVTEELAKLFREEEETFGNRDAFDRMALRVHEAQRATNPTLRRYWDAAASAEPGAWHEIPPVSVAAFKDMAIVSGAAEVVFRTSGTTAGAARRGEHHVASVDLYHAAARGNFRRHLFAAGAQAHARDGSGAHASDTRVLRPRRFALVSLIPPPEVVPDSSLSAMAGFVAREPEVTRTIWACHPERGLDVAKVVRAAGAATEPVLLLTTAFALVHILDALREVRLVLPTGSRIMETGGFKGRVAEVDRGTLYERVSEGLGVPSSHVVNEYGMTEMLSQAYDGVAGHALPAPERVHRFPPWVRTRALDPVDLFPLPPGKPGLLAHFDLANAASVCHLLTEDLGSTTHDGGVRLLGRAPGAGLRGCSLTAESFLRTTRRPGLAGGRPH